MQKMSTCSKTKAAYIAGFFDGEGSINVTRVGQVRVTIVQKRPEVLHWIKGELGWGTVREINFRDKWTCWRYGVFAEAQVNEFFSIVLPYVIVKRDEVIRAMELMEVPARERRGEKIRG